MARFTFKLEQVRLYRKQLEDQAMQALAQATARLEAIKARIEELETALDEQRRILSRSHSLTAAERWIAAQYETALKQDIALAFDALAEQEMHVDACRTDLVEKAKARGLLDSLKEKQAERHRLQELQKEQKTNDETATLRYRPVAL